MPRLEDYPLRAPYQLKHAIRTLDTQSPPLSTLDVVVDPDGRGDYTSIKEACDYVAGLTIYAPAGVAIARRILINPGAYFESAFTVPDWCILQGAAGGSAMSIAPAALTSIYFRDDSEGDLITMGSNAALVNLQLVFLGRATFGNAITGDTRLLYYPGTGTTTYSDLRNVTVVLQAEETDADTELWGIYATGGSFSYLNLDRVQILTKSAPGTHLKYLECAGGWVYAWHSWLNSNRPGVAATPVGAEASGTGILRLYDCYIGSHGDDVGGFTTDLVQSGSGVVRVKNTPYDISTGTITTITGAGGN